MISGLASNTNQVLTHTTERAVVLPMLIKVSSARICDNAHVLMRFLLFAKRSYPSEFPNAVESGLTNAIRICGDLSELARGERAGAINVALLFVELDNEAKARLSSQLRGLKWTFFHRIPDRLT